MKKGITLIEVMVVIVIIVVVFGMGMGVLHTIRNGNIPSDDDFDYSYLNPQFETARQQRKIAQELKRQNDLMEQRMNKPEQE